ncbi:hypothetical protein LBMAG46_17040 [Planctomycetia bacterium]|nr:hypothetical protein LBMAG46_17040 [Planctomycetia bacterium]
MRLQSLSARTLDFALKDNRALLVEVLLSADSQRMRVNCVGATGTRQRPPWR